MKIKELIKSFFPKRIDFIISIIIGISFAGFIYLEFLQRHFFSYRYFAYALLLALSGTFLSGWINTHVLRPKYKLMPKRIKLFSVISAVFLTMVLFLNIGAQPIYYLLPDTRLEIDFEIEEFPQEPEGVRLLWVKSGQGFVPYTYIEYEGAWIREESNTIFEQGQPVKLTWEGKVGSEAEIAFRKTNFHQPIKITWDGTSEVYDLNDSASINVVLRKNFKVNWIYYLPYVFSLLIATIYVILLLLTVIGNWEGIKKQPKEKNGMYWLLYAIPMIFAWLLFLLIFWPGVLSNDSVTIYAQALSGDIKNWQSALYTFILSILLKIIELPAFVLSIRIILFALIISRGLYLLEKYGVPRWILWMLSFFMAIFPSNLFYSVTLWKDIPYAYSVLLLSLILLSITLSNGKWASKNLNWIWLGVVGVLVSLLRHNGWPSSLLSLALLPFLFKKQWKYFSASILVALLLFFLIEGPLFNQIVVDEESTGQSNLVFLHHIAAHIEAGTELSDEEEVYLNSFLPIEDWEYEPCYVGSISYNNDFERKLFLKNTRTNLKLSLNLLARDPGVDIKHMLSAGELSYKFIGNECSIKSLHGFWDWDSGEEHWICPNDSGLYENSQFPEWITPIMSVFGKLGYFDGLVISFILPAFWLFLAVFSASVLVIRKQKIAFFLPILPVLVQSIVLFLIGFAPAFRYYYSNCLVGIMFLGCLFISKEEYQ